MTQRRAYGRLDVNIFSIEEEEKGREGGGRKGRGVCVCVCVSELKSASGCAGQRDLKNTYPRRQ